MTALAILLTVSTVHSAEIYRWKDADGRTHVSDKPPVDGGAERVQIRNSEAAKAKQAGNEPTSNTVVMLSASWCTVCKEARGWLSNKGIHFIEYDIEQSEMGKTEFRRLNGHGVPIILVGEKRLNGFSPEWIDAMLNGGTNGGR